MCTDSDYSRHFYYWKGSFVRQDARKPPSPPSLERDLAAGDHVEGTLRESSSLARGSKSPSWGWTLAAVDQGFAINFTGANETNPCSC